MAEAPAIGSIWRHSKSRGEYVVIGHARRESDLAILVLYQLVDLELPELPWTRPLAEWRETVTVNDDPVARFVWISGADSGTGQAE